MNAKTLTLLTVIFAFSWAARGAASNAPTASTARAIDPGHSTLTVYVYKEGLFAFAADNHEIAAPIASGSVDATSGTVDVTVDAKGMRVLDPRLSDARRAQVQSNMAGPQVLDVSAYPTIGFHAKGLTIASAGHFTIAGDLTLHGQTHAVSVDVTRADPTHFTGAAVVRQSSFGLTPIRIAGGMVRVKDDVKVVFDIALR